MGLSMSTLQGGGIFANALSRLETDDDGKISETEEGLVLSIAICAVEQYETIVMPETKENLVQKIMNFDKMESEEFPMSCPIHLVTVKLLPLPHPPVRARTDARTNPSAQRATQLRSVLVRVYAVSRQNQITTTVP
jgi:hypothetical protein